MAFADLVQLLGIESRPPARSMVSSLPENRAMVWPISFDCQCDFFCPSSKNLQIRWIWIKNWILRYLKALNCRSYNTKPVMPKALAKKTKKTRQPRPVLLQRQATHQELHRVPAAFASPFFSQIYSQKRELEIRFISGLSQVYLWFISGLSLVYLWFISGLSLVYLWFISGLSLV